MIIHTTRFGDVEVTEDKVLAFDHGLPGFPEEKSFALLPYQPDSPFSFLQSTTDPDLAFLVVDPFAFFADYEFELDEVAAQELELAADSLPNIVNIVTVPRNTADMTANLLAPLVINRRNQQGLQWMLEGTGYTTRHRLFPAGASSANLAKEAK